jgi:hypothetical protein
MFVFLTVSLLMLGYMHAHTRTHIDALAKRAQMHGRGKDVQVRGSMISRARVLYGLKEALT